MADRGKVIKALTECIFLHEHPDDDAGCFECPYRSDEIGTCQSMIPFLEDVMELLKKHEPRVLTLEEVIDHYSLPPVFVDDLSAQEDYMQDIVPLYFDFPSDDSWSVHWRGYLSVRQYLDDWKASYGKKWICWTGKPTDEQRKAVQWG